MGDVTDLPKHLIVYGFSTPESVDELLRYHPIILDNHSLSHDDILIFVALVTSSTGIRSFFWMLIRCIPMPSDHNEETRLLVELTEAKEIGYSQSRFCHEQIFTYQDLLRPVQDLPINITPSWSRVVRQMVDNVRSKLRFGSPLLPSYTKRKNIGYESARHFMSLTGQGENHTNITPFELERYYARTGVKTSGPCEVRSTWRFNELKPRFYYAQGATSYHASKYMKEIAKVFMDSNPSSREKSRTYPTEYMNLAEQDHLHIVIWDLTSFTTNLSELPYFLAHFAWALDSEYGQSDTIPIVDLHEGLLHVRLSDLLMDYVESCTIGSKFSMERLSPLHEVEIFSSQNSGLLGVPGNIGFSTTLHGYIAAQCLGPENTVAVGDDACGATEDPEDIISTIQCLGIIQREKFGIMHPPDRSDDSSQWLRFLKRRLERGPDGLTLDQLLPLPLLPLLTGVIPEHNARPRDFSFRDRVKKIVTIASSLNSNPLFIDELGDKRFHMIVQELFIKMYRAHSLPVRGSLPGFIVNHNGESIRIPWVVPPIIIHQPSPTFNVDWLQILWDSRPQRFFELPMMDVERELLHFPRFQAGDRFVAHKSRVLTILEDFEVIETEAFVELVENYSNENFEKLKRWIRSELKAPVVVRALKSIPDWALTYVTSEQSSMEMADLGHVF